MLLNNEWVNNEIKKEIKNYLETNENENIKIQILWDSGKAVVRRKFTALQAHFKKRTQEKSQINNLTLYLKGLEKAQQTKVSRRKEIIKIRAEISEIEPNKTIQTSMKQRAVSLKI